MKKLLFASFSLFILLGACKKDDNHPCPSIGEKQTWKKYEGNPVFTKGAKSWDDGFGIGHSVIKSGNGFKMWYGGSSSSNPESGSAIGYATSADGINWTRYSGNPVFKGMPGSWDEMGVGVPVVLQDGNILRMWYLAGPSGPDGGKFGYATSADGVHWDRHPSPVFQSLPGSWYRDGLLPGIVIKEKGILKCGFPDQLDH